MEQRASKKRLGRPILRGSTLSAYATRQGEMDGVISDIGRLDADHFFPVVGGHVGHAFGLVNPWIPNDGAIKAALLDDDTAVPHWVVYHASGIGAQVHLIGFLGDAHRLVAHLLALESIGLVTFLVGYSIAGPWDPVRSGARIEFLSHLLRHTPGKLLIV